MTRRTFSLSLGIVALTSLMLRLVYVSWSAAYDPAFGRPGLDGAVYVAWARDVLGGHGEPPGAFYLAPLYPHLLSMFFLVVGESWKLLYVTQHAMVVVAACFLAFGAVGRVGEVGALLGAIMALLYHPAAFFASRPIGEPVALLLAALGAYLYSRGPARSMTFAALAGFTLGLAALARPNLLLIVAGLALVDVVERGWMRALTMVAATAVALAPVSARNLAVSGHPVLVSANGGMTLYHGNGPGALGIYTPSRGFSGAVAHQRDEATAYARAQTGKPLDAVAADRWWGRRALETRLHDPLGTVGLFARKIALTLDDYEHGLDDAPALDINPWRRAFPLRWFLLAGFATVGAVGLGFRASGGAAAWVPILATAATPVAFYVSSRYRLPMALFLCVPAGAGAALAFRAVRGLGDRRGFKAIAVGSIVALCSIVVPSRSLARTEESLAHANRASTFAEARDFPRAEAEARKALALDPSSVLASYNLGVIMSAGGRNADAEVAYRRALGNDPSHAESAGNLAKLLVERGAASEAVPILEEALASRPGDAACWTNLVVAHLAQDDMEQARRALERGERAGVRFAPELIQAMKERER